MDLEIVFLQAQGFDRVFYVILPPEAGSVEVLWKLELAAYRLTASGRLWYLNSNDVLINRHRLTRSKLDYTIYYSLDANQHLKFIPAVYVDDYMYTGTEIDMETFEAFLRSTFDASKFACGSLDIMGCKIT